MSVTPKVIFNCDHITIDRVKTYGQIEMLRDLSGGFPDKVPANISIVRIDEITDIAEDRVYSKGIDFEQNVSNDIIEWINPSNNPVPGEKYLVTASYLKTVVSKRSTESCDRCGGNGWYVDIFGGGDNSIPMVKGESKLLQDFIKVMFTEKSADGYGSNINDALASNVYNEVDLGLKISTSVNDCCDQIKESQKEHLNSGLSISQEEALDSIEINQILFVREEGACYISLKIINGAGKPIKFSFKI